MEISDDDLIRTAESARENAYCRYSGFSVGAAILDEHGQLHIGCNVENASYPLGSCAEAAAIAAMVQGGGRHIERIAIVGGSGDIAACTPCGGCRQRIQEFADDNTVIIVSSDNGEGWQNYSIAELLPASFKLNP
jgi:cytidine deaminase